MECDSPRVYVLLSQPTLHLMRSWRDLFGPAVSPDALSAVLDTFSWPGWAAGEAFEVACVIDAPLIEFCTLGFVHAIHPADEEACYIDSPWHRDAFAGSPVPAADIWAAEAFFRFARRIDED
jgi:hypothetical protein